MCPIWCACRISVLTVALTLLSFLRAVADPVPHGPEFPGPAPGKAEAQVTDAELILGNRVIECRWSTAGGNLTPVSIEDKLSGATVVFDRGRSECFRLLLKDGEWVSASTMRIDGALVGDHMVTIAKGEIIEVVVDPGTRSLVEKRRLPPGKLVPTRYNDPSRAGLRATVTADGPNDFTFELTD